MIIGHWHLNATVVDLPKAVFLYSVLLRKTEYIVIVKENGGNKRGHMVL